MEAKVSMLMFPPKVIEELVELTCPICASPVPEPVVAAVTFTFPVILVNVMLPVKEDPPVAVGEPWPMIA